MARILEPHMLSCTYCEHSEGLVYDERERVGEREFFFDDAK